MRDFKFRVWNTFEEEMSYNVLVNNNLIIFNYDIEYEGCFNASVVAAHFVVFDEIYRKHFKIMQYTGIKDRHGQEIYEGDIVRDKYNKIGYVSFLKQELGFCVVYKNFDCRLGHRNTGSCYDIDTNIEVIGNIYINKELIE